MNTFARLGLGSSPGAVFSSVTRGSPADKAGLRPLKPLKTDQNGIPIRLSGDVITAINGVRIHNFDELLRAVRARQVGDVIKLSVVRDGKPIPDLSLQAGAAHHHGGRAALSSADRSALQRHSGPGQRIGHGGSKAQ